jgi:hypothetical protein
MHITNTEGGAQAKTFEKKKIKKKIAHYLRRKPQNTLVKKK